MAGQFIKSLHPRHKRSDCVYQLSIPQSCLCGDHCWIDSYKHTLATDCGTDSTLNCCVIRNQNAYQLSSNCPAMGTYQNIACARTGNVCGDGLTAYQCTCSDGYLTPTTTTTTTTPTTTQTPTSSEMDTTWLIALGVVLPLVIGIVILLSMFRYLRVYRRKKAAELDKKIQTGIIPIKCNVMILVDDLDEFKDYTTRLTVALQDRFPKIVCERLSTYSAINDKYEIKCDRLLVFRAMYKVTRKRDALTNMTEKIRFRQGRKISDIVLCKEDGVTTNSTYNGKERCLVSSMKHIGGWLPAVIQILFDIKERNTNRYNLSNKTFFTKTECCSSNSSYCAELRCTIENTLIACGACAAQSEKMAICKLAFLDAKDDILVTNGESDIDLKGFFVFVSPGTNVNGFRNSNRISVYRSKDLILGIIRLLFKLKLISGKEMPGVRRMRYNPISQEFI